MMMILDFGFGDKRAHQKTDNRRQVSSRYILKYRYSYTLTK